MSDYTERKRRYVHDLESKIATHVCTEDSFRAFETEIWVRVIDYRRQVLEAENERLRAFVERRAKPSLTGCECPCHEEAAELLARGEEASSG